MSSDGFYLTTPPAAALRTPAYRQWPLDPPASPCQHRLQGLGWSREVVMDIVEQELATVERADAYQSDDLLIVRVSGETPTACHIVSIERALTDVEPPAFAVRMRINPMARCMQQG